MGKKVNTTERNQVNKSRLATIADLNAGILGCICVWLYNCNTNEKNLHIIKASQLGKVHLGTGIRALDRFLNFRERTKFCSWWQSSLQLHIKKQNPKCISKYPPPNNSNNSQYQWSTIWTLLSLFVNVRMQHRNLILMFWKCQINPFIC